MQYRIRLGVVKSVWSTTNWSIILKVKNIIKGPFDWHEIDIKHPKITVSGKALKVENIVFHKKKDI